MLKDLKESSLTLLDEALHFAIVHNRVDIAVSALDLGASTAAYNVDAKKPDAAKAGDAVGGDAVSSVSETKASSFSSLLPSLSWPIARELWSVRGAVELDE